MGFTSGNNAFQAEKNRIERTAAGPIGKERETIVRELLENLCNASDSIAAAKKTASKLSELEKVKFPPGFGTDGEMLKLEEYLKKIAEAIGWLVICEGFSIADFPGHGG